MCDIPFNRVTGNIETDLDNQPLYQLGTAVLTGMDAVRFSRRFSFMLLQVGLCALVYMCERHLELSFNILA